MKCPHTFSFLSSPLLPSRFSNLHLVTGVLYEDVSFCLPFIEMMQQNSLGLTGEMAYSCGVYCRVCPSLFVRADSPGGTL